MNRSASASVFRFALGEVTPGAPSKRADVAVQSARRIFLWQAERQFPAMRDELVVEMGKHYFKEPAEFCELVPELREFVAGYCERWGLTDGREPASWALDVVAETISHWAALGRPDAWYLPISFCHPLDPEERTLSDGDTFDPFSETLKSAKSRKKRSAWPELTAVVSLAAKRGAQAAMRLRSPEKVMLAVRHQVGHEKYLDIARTLIDVGDEEALRQCVEVVKQDVRDVLRVVGLQAPRGRPRRPSAR